MASDHQSYLLDRQRDITRLRRIAIDEFVRARNSRQLIACVGSYASLHLGYPSWRGLVSNFIDACVIEPKQKSTMAGLKALRDKADVRFSDTDFMDMAELLASRDRHSDFRTFNAARERFSNDNFALKGTVEDAIGRPSIAAALFRNLGISRIVTLNYDLELEWEAFFTDFERKSHLAKRRAVFWTDHFPPERPTTMLEREVPGFGRATSEILVREDSAPLIEFALGGPRDLRRIFHLHGRVDIASSLLVTRRDYRDLYWESGFSKLPFEYGLRLVFSANPILFVGIGMSELEVTQALEQMLSDNPNRRAVPMFLLWSSSGSRDADDAFRLLFNRKLGVHVLFDEEIAADILPSKAYAANIAAEMLPGGFDDVEPLQKEKMISARRLDEPLKMLAQLSDRHRNTFWEKADFRTPQLKYRGNPTRVNVWSPTRNSAPLQYRRLGGTEPFTPLTDRDAERELVEVLRSHEPVQVIIGEPGTGRGALASAMAAAYENHYASGNGPPGRVVLINGSFVTETDSVFAILSGAFDGRTAYDEDMSRESATTTMLHEIQGIFADCKANTDDAIATEPRCAANSDDLDRELTVIINGMERFIAHDGSALSTELDSLIRLVTQASEHLRNELANDREGGKSNFCFPVRLVLMGTPRLLRYFNVVASGLSVTKATRERENPTLRFGDHEFSVECPSYFSKLMTRLPGIDDPGSFKGPSRRRGFLGKVFDRIANGGGGITNPNVALEIIRILAFIGQPTEQHVLLHVPSLWAVAPPDEDLASTIETAVRELLAGGLLIEIEGFPTAPSRRLGIHKAVIAEVRQRHGVPISDARLASGFNIGLYTAQPVDSFLPDQRWHQDIGKIVDFLAGQHKDDIAADPLLEAAGKALHKSVGRRRHRMAAEIADYSANQLARIAAPAMTDCLRAALSLMRSYYSTSALLMFGNRDLNPLFNEGPLSQHSERLVRLIRAARTAVTVRREIRNNLERSSKGEIERLLGPEAYYADDLVWLNNELGLVRTTQGDLIGARAALEEAKRIDEQFLDFGERNQNWRRISLNLVQIDIDSGNIEEAEERLRDIESAIEAESYRLTATPARTIGGYIRAPFMKIRDFVVTNYAHGECSALTERTNATCPTDIIVAVAIVLGYRGLCFHLRGAFDAAEENLRDATAVLERLNEQRAYAFFQRHRASLMAAMGKPDEAKAVLGLCLAAAGPSRQIDIDHSARIAQVQYGVTPHLPDTRPSKGQVIPQLIETLRYATTGDMYRIQIEAMQNMASAHLRNGDTDSAMKFATDALAVATRNGFELRKVSLRILLGRIMVLRGDRTAGKKLLLRASEIGTKLHYDTAVEKAEDALVLLGQGAAEER